MDPARDPFSILLCGSLIETDVEEIKAANPIDFQYPLVRIVD